MNDKMVKDGTITEKIKPIILSTKGLAKTFKLGRELEVHALRDISFEVSRGEFISIVGPSGSGKSTLLNMMGCLDRPTRGDIFIDDQLVSKLRKSKLTDLRREKIGFVFQQYNLIPTLTALENVMLPLKYTGVSRKQAKIRAAQALEQVGLEGRIHHRPFELSGGEQQRVTVARSLINKPAIVLADEPTGELDTHTSEQIIKLLRSLNESAGQTFIIVTHNLEVASVTDRVVKMRDGKLEGITKN